MNNTLVHKRQKQKGFTLPEVGIAMAIALVILLGAVKLYGTYNLRKEVNLAITDVQYIMNAAADWRSTRSNYTGVTMALLNTSGLLPSTIGAGTSANPWGGNYSIAAYATDASKIVITLTNVNATASAQLNDKLKATSDGGAGTTISGTTFTVRY